MLKNISIKLKLILSFSAIVIMIVLLAFYSIYSTGKSGNGFVSYQNMVSDSDIISEINSSMLKISMNVKDYLSTESNEDIDKFNNNINKTEKLIENAKKQLKKPSAVEKIEEINKKLFLYKNSFNEVINFVNERNKIKKEVLDVLGEDIEHLLSLVITRTKKEKNYDASSSVSEALKNVILARMYTYKFLDSYNKDDFHKVYEIFNALTNTLEELQEKIKNPIVYSQFNMSFKFIVEYKNSAFSIYDVITAKNKLVNNKLSLLEKEITTLSDGMEANIKKDQERVGTVVKDLNGNIKSLITIISLIIVVFAVLISIILPRHISGLIFTFQSGLLTFFKYLNKETQNAELIKADGKNEIASMANLVNQNIQKTEKALVQDIALIDDVQRVVDQVKLGRFTTKIEKNTESESLNKLKNSFNEMLINIRNNVCDDINEIVKVLDAYSKLDFRNKVNDDKGKISIGLNNVSEIITNMLVQNQSIGLTLDKSSNQLIANVENLNQLSTQTAASLEETAAALEEITSTIISNAENVGKMSNYTKVLGDSAKTGQQLAQNTTIAMDDITDQVSLINETITIIDQIAFQTNILSLNAAVEAATAGEAGKGFAVVAQEVRNLASRSAEAAKEIKDIVESATTKATHGKSISDEMIKGYDSLLETVTKSIQMIEEINVASKEQESGINQINDAVTNLDQQTQQNAQIANETQEIAIQTDKIAKEIVNDANKKEFTGKKDI